MQYTFCIFILFQEMSEVAVILIVYLILQDSTFEVWRAQDFGEIIPL